MKASLIILAGVSAVFAVPTFVEAGPDDIDPSQVCSNLPDDKHCLNGFCAYAHVVDQNGRCWSRGCFLGVGEGEERPDCSFTPEDTSSLAVREEDDLPFRFCDNLKGDDHCHNGRCDVGYVSQDDGHCYESSCFFGFGDSGKKPGCPVNKEQKRGHPTVDLKAPCEELAGDKRCYGGFCEYGYVADFKGQCVNVKCYMGYGEDQGVYGCPEKTK